MKAASSTRACAALTAALGALFFASGCGVIDRLTSAEDFAIQKFAVDHQAVAPGSPVLLSWNVEGADVVEIDNGVGRVTAKGSKQLRPEVSATYTLTARAGTAVATASVQVVVRGGSPSPAPLPTPSPSAPPPSPTPSPSPSGTPPPGTDPPDKAAVSCGTRAPAFGACSLSVTKATLPVGQCIELTSISFDRDCPVAFATPRKLEFSVRARVATARALTWRRGRASADVLTPATGSLDAQGVTRVEIDDLALASALVIEIVDGDRVLLTFSVGHD